MIVIVIILYCILWQQLSQCHLVSISSKYSKDIVMIVIIDYHVHDDNEDDNHDNTW